MQNSEIKSAEHRAIERNAVEDARDLAECLSRKANENLCIWLAHERGPGDAKVQRDKMSYELSERRARQALNVYKFLTRPVHS